MEKKNDTVERNPTECKVCKQVKLRILAGKWDDTNKRWNDETGSAWNGRTCPQCHKEKVAKRWKERAIETARKKPLFSV